ncbi:hypothetical protein JCM19241_4858 [Vibrio ishigakensis]|uniref:SHOCT domain-containing protein n=1 Tax=Vibrio ishigakensis TaxID=1481914 RepID=A0A0B8QT13_9VIBR|nr:hypothetical protein JCM19241_4858 [Vibrio ishigakensis]
MARDFAAKSEQSVSLPKWEEVTIVDHGRDILTAIMNVNCEYTYKYRKFDLTTNKVNDLNSLVDLYERGLLTDSEFSKAKSQLLEK